MELFKKPLALKQGLGESVYCVAEGTILRYRIRILPSCWSLAFELLLQKQLSLRSELDLMLEKSLASRRV